MCMMKTPKIETPAVKEPEYLRNPFLDAARNDRANANALRVGRNQLRIQGSENGMGLGFSGRVTTAESQNGLITNALAIRSSLTGQAARFISKTGASTMPGGGNNRDPVDPRGKQQQ